MKTLVIVIIIILLVGGGYYLFMHSHTSPQRQATSAPTQTAGSNQTGSQNYPHPTGGSGGFGRGHFGNMPSGSTPIFGQVTAVNGDTLTVQRQSRNGSGTTITIDLTSSTQYTGGSQSNIQTGTRIGGYGTKNSDGSINAEKITINPTFPTRSSSQNGGQ